MSVANGWERKRVPKGRNPRPAVHPQQEHLSGTHAGKVGYSDDDDGTAPGVYFAEPISSGYVLIQHDHLANVTSLEHEPWKRAHSEVCHRIR